MRIAEKVQAIELLEEICEINAKDAVFYKTAFLRAKRLFFKNLYFRLYKQKEAFNEQIRKQMKNLQKELSLLGEDSSSVCSNVEAKGAPGDCPQFRNDEIFYECYQREKRSWEKYHKALPQINHGSIREILLCHRHAIRLILNEIKIIGATKYPV